MELNDLDESKVTVYFPGQTLFLCLLYLFFWFNVEVFFFPVYLAMCSHWADPCITRNVFQFVMFK